MAVTLTPLAATNTEAVTDGFLLLTGSALAVAIAVDTSHVEGLLVLRGDAVIDEFGVVVPEIPPVADGSLFLSGEAEMYSGTGSDVDGMLYLSGEAAPAGTTDGTLYLSGEANSSFEFNGYYIFAAEDYEVVSSYVGMNFAAVEDSVHLTTAPSRLYTQVVRELYGMRTSRRTVYEGSVRLRDDVAFAQTLAYVIRAFADDNLVLDGDATAAYTAVGRIAARLILAGIATNYAEAENLIVEALVLSSFSDAFMAEFLAENVVLSDAVAGVYTAFVNLLERIALAAAAAPSYNLTVMLRDDVVLATTQNGDVDLTAAIRDAIGFAMTLSFDDGNYMAWVLNTESTGLTNYTNFPFNSMAKIGSRYYGLHSGGIVRLGGDTDDGDPIASKVRFGMFDFGDRHLKAFSEVYVGSSGGQLLLKVIWTDDGTGEKLGAIYRMKARPATAVREARFEPGKGLQAVDWDFELENVDGADFDIHTVQFQPMVKSRRTRG